MGDLIDRQAAMLRIAKVNPMRFKSVDDFHDACVDCLRELPSAQPERDTPKRVLWTGWKGFRYTRYNCPNCKKPVRNDDVCCHRCGQRLMFPHISFTNYVPGEKQDVIVRWDDEG